MDGIKAGMEVYHNYDHRFTQSVERSRIRRAIDARCEVSLSERGIVARYIDCEGGSVEVMRDIALDRAKSVEKIRSVAEEQMAKSGDTIFRITKVEVSGAEWFATAKLLAEVRREALSKLAASRFRESEVKDAARVVVEGLQYPIKHLTPQHNVVNELSRRFYKRFGVEHIEEGLDCRSTTLGERVMESSYCIRREIGECLKRGSKLRDTLYLEHGRHRYRLDFDCAQCRMLLIDCSENETFR
jgi:putative protease